MMKGEPVVIHRSGSKEFVPAVQPDVFREGSVESRHLIEKKRKKERQDLIFAAAEECTKLIQKNQPQKLINYLRSMPRDVLISHILDRDGYSLLHMAAFNNRTICLQVLLQKAKQDLYQHQVSEWVNLKTTKDEFTSLHYAAFKGNIQIVQMLVDNGADMKAKNLHGLNVLHIAAQGDQPISLFYFKSQNMDIYCKDNRNSTPLHWACFSNSEVALVYLLGWYEKDKLNMKDQDGFTPLHLAVKSADQLQSGRPVRALLMKGATRDVRDNNGQTPHDLADMLNGRRLAREIKEALTSDTTCNCLMLKPVLKKTEKSMEMPLAFMGFFITIYMILFVFLFPRWQSSFLIYFLTASGLVSYVFWFKTTFSDPGILSRPSDVDFLVSALSSTQSNNLSFQKLMQVIDPLHLCPECLVIKTPRSRHCSVCNKCVERYDHHCPWVNNCVGIRNHRDFMIFLSATVLSILAAFVGAVVELVRFSKIDHLDETPLNYMVLPEAWYRRRPLFNAMMWITILVTGFFLMPILLLFYIQAKNFLLNRTTHERYSKKKVATHNGKKERLSVASEVSRDSTGSSLLSVMQLHKASEDILNEFGAPEDFSGRRCSCILNQYAMLCNRSIPN